MGVVADRAKARGGADLETAVAIAHALQLGNAVEVQNAAEVGTLLGLADHQVGAARGRPQRRIARQVADRFVETGRREGDRHPASSSARARKIPS